nr:hypothetical protein [Gemmatimonadota bacterium]
MSNAPYVRLRPEDLRGRFALRGWTPASAELIAELGLAPGRELRLPIAMDAGGRSDTRRHVREGLVTLLALEPSHPDRSLYLDVIQRCFTSFEPWLERRVARSFSSGRYAEALSAAVTLVNLVPGRGESRFNLGLLLTRLVSCDSGSPDAGRWRALARGEF